MKTSTVPKIFETNHTAQIKWLNGQIAKNNTSIFLNPSKALEAYDTLNNENMGIIDKEIETFIKRYLSESGIKKLGVTLRVAETRAKKGKFRLQCNIEYSNNIKLEKMMKAKGMEKGDVINQLIEQAVI
jgi:hypothetical protein